ncbi:crotonobetaine/carnitine-CoA ligase [Stackebrandtia endophytica]|uniref:Crotonobetaine/carnitine-CoA ligase n=1 Tax=Stackebrandtia endophytica TaxID=1496996 RepID=A0A543B0U8_9ACTN|nr:AMP-binding protein [Stackebrandtia endophytica]TQL78465.1 crotonobetaine/carnitine-CoA ligase [Stackebrandtia endophytica]
MAFRATDLPDRLDRDETLLLPLLLRRRAETDSQRVFLQNTDGGQLTYGQLDDRVRRWMSELVAAGVTPGDRVSTLLPPSFDAVAVWMATARLGAVEAPTNTALHGEFLAHVLRDCEPRCIVTTSRFVTTLDELGVEPTVIVADGEVPTNRTRFSVPSFQTVYDGTEAELSSHDVATMVYTSGTSGRSKGVVVPWAQEYATARWLMPLDGREGDIWYGPWAMYHVSGKVGLYSSALLDGKLVIRDGFSTSHFWSDIRRHGVTSTMIVASTVSFLSQQPASPTDREHTLRNVCASPMPSDPAGFAERFGVRLSTLFNMTETASPIVTGWDDFPSGSCGRLRPNVAARIVDEHGRDVDCGRTGELLVRSNVPHEIMAGYWRAPETTVESWRDLWFHTGDAVRCDAEGNYYFIDRLKDTIRRGGENISSVELEAAVNEHSLVKESAAVGIATPWDDRDVKLFIVPLPGFDAAELARDLDRRLPRYMRPSVISVIEALPKTHTARIRKDQLRLLNDEPVWVRPKRKANT